MKNLRTAIRIVIASAWIFHSLASKVLNLIPRHELIVARIIGRDTAVWATPLIGAMEIVLGLWVLGQGWRFRGIIEE